MIHIHRVYPPPRSLLALRLSRLETLWQPLAVQMHPQQR